MVLLQSLLLLSVCLFFAAAILFLVFLVRYARNRTRARELLVTGCFHLGAIAAGWVVWQAMKPSGWALPFWITVKAGADAQTYGHAIEHTAELLATYVILLSAVGGVFASLVAIFATRLRRA